MSKPEGKVKVICGESQGSCKIGLQDPSPKRSPDLHSEQRSCVVHCSRTDRLLKINSLQRRKAYFGSEFQNFHPVVVWSSLLDVVEQYITEEADAPHHIEEEGEKLDGGGMEEGLHLQSFSSTRHCGLGLCFSAWLRI